MVVYILNFFIIFLLYYCEIYTGIFKKYKVKSPISLWIANVNHMLKPLTDDMIADGKWWLIDLLLGMDKHSDISTLSQLLTYQNTFH